MTNKLSTSQFFLLATVLICTFKLNKFAPLIYKDFNSCTILVVTFYVLFDFLLTFFIYLLAKKDFFYSISNKRQLFLSVSLSVFIAIKLAVYFFDEGNFINNYLVKDMKIWLVYLILFVVAICFSRFGLNSLARTNEILLPLVVLLLILNLVFMRVEFKFNYTVPVLTEWKGFNSVFSYFIYSFDSLPLIVCSIKDRNERKKKTVLSISSIILGVIFVFLIVYFGISIYGMSFKDVDNLYVKIAIFNDYNLTFGRLDWIGVICYLFCSIMVCLCYIIALKYTTQIATKTKRNTSIIYVIFVYFILLFYLVDEKIVQTLSIKYLGYIVFYLASFSLLFMLFLQIWGQNDKKDTKK